MVFETWFETLFAPSIQQCWNVGCWCWDATTSQTTMFGASLKKGRDAITLYNIYNHITYCWNSSQLASMATDTGWCACTHQTTDASTLDGCCACACTALSACNERPLRGGIHGYRGGGADSTALSIKFFGAAPIKLSSYQMEAPYDRCHEGRAVVWCDVVIPAKSQMRAH